MRILLIGLLTILSTSVYAKNTCSDGKELVSRVIDGDTIEMEDGKMIRILGIDTYDINRRMAKKQSYRTGYSIAKVEYLSELGSKEAKNRLLGECVRLIKGRKDKGAYHRYLRYVEIHGRDYQKIMLHKGLANVYCGDKKARRFKAYLKISKFKCEKK